MSVFKFAFKLNFFPEKLELYNENKLKALFLRFDYIDSWLEFDEIRYLHPIKYYFSNFYGNCL